MYQRIFVEGAGICEDRQAGSRLGACILGYDITDMNSSIQTASYRIHALDVEVETVQSKLRQKERTISVCHGFPEQLRHKLSLTWVYSRICARPTRN